MLHMEGFFWGGSKDFSKMQKRILKTHEPEREVFIDDSHNNAD